MQDARQQVYAEGQSITSMLVKISLATVVLGALVLVACGGGLEERYEAQPHESWKARGAYCFRIMSDPRGDHNTRFAFSDDAALVDGVVRATNVRVTQITGHHQPNDAERDYFQAAITWTVGDGRLDVTRGCPLEESGYANN